MSDFPRTRALFTCSGVAVALLTVAAPAGAEVKKSGPDHLILEHRLPTPATPAALFRAAGQVGRWWNGQHTFSGQASNLSLKTQAGACFCETWNKGSVAHGRVVHAERDRLLRLDAPLGPLQEMAVNAVLTFSFLPPDAASGSKESTLLVTYRVSGDPSHGLAALGAVIDGVIGEQAARLARFAATGRAE